MELYNFTLINNTSPASLNLIIAVSEHDGEMRSLINCDHQGREGMCGLYENTVGYICNSP